MQVLRTPDGRFENIPDYPFQPNYITVKGVSSDALRMHYVDVGPKAAAPVLCLHGEPTWSYLYRHMLPIFEAAGHRTLAPDLIGFGKSDKPGDRAAYTYRGHVAWMSDFVVGLDLRGITLVCQDWGGLIGLRLLAAMPERFSRLVVANTALPTGDQPMGPAFAAWRAFSQEVDPFLAGRIVYGGTETKISVAEQAAYDAPFPDETFKAGARQFPLLVPDRPDDPASADNRAAWKVLETLTLPVLTLFGAEDRVMAGVDRIFQTRMRGAAGQPHDVLSPAGHFLQEDVGPELAARVNAFVADTSG